MSRTHRVYLPEAHAPGDAALRLPEEEERHVQQVLRARQGDRIEVLNGRGDRFAGEFLCLAVPGARRAAGAVRIVELLEREEPPPLLAMALALTRTDAFEDALRRAVELGATALWPLASDNAVVELKGDRAQKRRERWTRIAVEALKQCERLHLPEVQEAIDVDQALGQCETRHIDPVALLERGDALPRLAALRTDRPTAIFVGPEGGWSAPEREHLRKRARCATLGPRILRAETAALAALALWNN